jgi:hypothetical protein
MAAMTLGGVGHVAQQVVDDRARLGLVVAFGIALATAAVCRTLAHSSSAPSGRVSAMRNPASIRRAVFSLARGSGTSRTGRLRSCPAWRYSSSTQVSLVPPPCEEFTTSDPFFSATRVSPPGVMLHAVGEHLHEGAQVDMARREALLGQDRHGRQRQRRLGDVVAGPRLQLLAEGAISFFEAAGPTSMP